MYTFLRCLFHTKVNLRKEKTNTAMYRNIIVVMWCFAYMLAKWEAHIPNSIKFPISFLDSINIGRSIEFQIEKNMQKKRF